MIRPLTTISEGKSGTPAISGSKVMTSYVHHSYANERTIVEHADEESSSKSSMADQTESYESLSDYKEESESHPSAAFNVAGDEGSVSADESHFRARESFMCRLKGLSQHHKPVVQSNIQNSFRYQQATYLKHLKLKREEQEARERGDIFVESEHKAIFEKLKNTRLPCIKYNHCLDQSIAN